MNITLCGSARFEQQFRELDRRLTLAGHVVYNLAVYPSEMGGKDWYTSAQKATLDSVHLAKIRNSDAIVVINSEGYIGQSTAREIRFALDHGKIVYTTYPSEHRRLCPYAGCADPIQCAVCALCYE